MDKCNLIETCRVFQCNEKAQYHLITHGKKTEQCRVHYCAKHYPEMMHQFCSAHQYGWTQEPAEKKKEPKKNACNYLRRLEGRKKLVKP